MFVYALICNTFNLKIKSKMYKFSEFLKNYENYFYIKNAKTFFEHENKDRVVYLVLDAELLYKLLYILSKTEFNVLKNYFVKKFDLKLYTRLYEFCKRINIFVLKKNDNFRLYVDYKKLNIFIIKNKCSLFLIDEILNRFINVSYFIRLDLKNAYHRIKLYKNDE